MRLGVSHAVQRWDDFGAALVFVITMFYFLLAKFENDPYHHLWFERPQADMKIKAKEVESNIAKVLRESVSLCALPRRCNRSKPKKGQ